MPSWIGRRALTLLLWPWCYLCRCLTLPGLHRILLHTAMLSCPSQEDRGETSSTRGSLGVYPDVCHFLHLHVVSAVLSLYVGVLERRSLSIGVKERWLFRALCRHLDPLTFSMVRHNSASVTIAKCRYSCAFLNLGIRLLRIRVFHEN